MSFFGSLFGSDQRKDVKRAYKDSTGMLDRGADAARGALGEHYTQAQNYLAPFLEGGPQANSLLMAYLGASGPEAQQQAFANFQNDPGYQAQFNAGVGALDRSATARGGLYSGAAMKGLQEYGQQFQRQAYNDRINHLMGLSGQGMQAASGASSLAANQGNTLAGLEFGLGQQHASNRINYGNALAQSRNTGINNLLNIAGTVASAFGIPGVGGGAKTTPGTMANGGWSTTVKPSNALGW